MRVGNIGWRRRLRERDCESWEYWMEKEAEGERLCELGILDGEGG